MTISFILTTLSSVFYQLNNLFNGGGHIVNTISQPQLTNGNYPICVIGAGLSGLNVANLLQNKGHVVHVYEKDTRVGGKVFTYRSDGIQVEMGPIVFSSVQEAIMEKIKEFGFTTVPVNISDASYFDPDTGGVFPRPIPTEEQMMNIRDALRSYANHSRMYEDGLEFGYVNASPDIFVPISDWLDERNLGALKPILIGYITILGYGALEDVPALYALKLANPPTLSNIALNNPRWYSTTQEGLDRVAERMADSVQVHLNKEVTGIFRGRDHQAIYFNNEQHQGRKCKSVILAFTPLLSNVEKIVHLSENERRVLENVKIHHYTSGAHYIPPLNQTVYYEPKPRGTGEVIALINQSLKERKNIFGSYSWIRGDFSSGPSAPDLVNIDSQLQATMRRIHPNSETFFRRVTEYFPHVTTQAITNGFFRDFYSIQGQGGLYYATTLLTFENMEQSLQMTRSFVQRFF